MVEGALREAAGLRQRQLPGVLGALADQVFAKYPVPDGADGRLLGEGAALVRERLEATQAGPPRPVRDMPEPMARMVFDALPMHKEIVTNDYDYIFNNLRMNLLRAHEDFLAAAQFARDRRRPARPPGWRQRVREKPALARRGARAPAFLVVISADQTE